MAAEKKEVLFIAQNELVQRTEVLFGGSALQSPQLLGIGAVEYLRQRTGQLG